MIFRNNRSIFIDFYLYYTYIRSMQIEGKLVAVKQMKKIPKPDKIRIFTQVDSLEVGLEGKPSIKKLVNHQYDQLSDASRKLSSAIQCA